MENLKRFGLKPYNTQSLDLKDDSVKMEMEPKKYLTMQNRNKYLILKRKKKRVPLKRMCECLEWEAYLWPQDPDNDSSQLFMLASKFPHLVKASLKLPVSWVDAPHHLQILFPFPLNDVSQQHLQFLIFIIPSLKNFKACDHNLGCNIRKEAYY